jgi:hypothetical protein
MISKDTIKSDVWNIFKTLIKANATSVTIQGSGGANTKTITCTKFSQSYPDTVFDTEGNYPMVIINSPEYTSTPTTFQDRELDVRMSFEVYTTQSESADKFIDLITSTIINNEDTLREDGIFEVEVDSTDSNHYDRNKISVHSRMVTFRMKVEI